MCSVSVLLPFVHFQVRASHGSVLAPPLGTTTSGSYIAPWANVLLGRPPPAYGLKFFVKAGERRDCRRSVSRKRFRNCLQVQSTTSSGFVPVVTGPDPVDYRNVPENDSIGSCPSSRNAGRTVRPG